jgi:hypothetical protein
MNKLLRLSVGILALTIGQVAFADGVQLHLRMGLPSVLPPLVEIQPGVRVVQDFDQEVFFTNGYYWSQRDGNWYRTRDHRGTWNYVRPERAPVALTRLERGHYRGWQHDEHRSWPEARRNSRARHWRDSDRH